MRNLKSCNHQNDFKADARTWSDGRLNFSITYLASKDKRWPIWRGVECTSPCVARIFGGSYARLHGTERHLRKCARLFAIRVPDPWTSCCANTIEPSVFLYCQTQTAAMELPATLASKCQAKQPKRLTVIHITSETNYPKSDN